MTLLIIWYIQVFLLLKFCTHIYIYICTQFQEKKNYINEKYYTYNNRANCHVKSILLVIIICKNTQLE